MSNFMTTTGTFEQAMDASVRALFDTSSLNEYNNISGLELFREYDPDVPEAKLSVLSGPGRGTLTLETQAYGSNDRYKGYAMEVRLDKFTSLLEYSEEAKHFLQKAQVSKQATDVNMAVESAVQALYENWNEEIAKVFYLGFGTTNLIGGDGVALFSEAHPTRKSGVGNQANTFGTGSTHKAFTAATLVEGIDKMSRLKDNNGVQFARPKNIEVVCSHELSSTVIQAIESMYGPTTANLGLNIGSSVFLKKRGVNVGVTVLPNIPSAYQNYWFLVDKDRSRKMAARAVAWRPRVASDVTVQNGTQSYACSTLFGHHWGHFGWVFGSKGDGTAI
jgi:hypothetical protein